MTSPWSDWIDVGPRYDPEQPGYVHKFQRAVTHLNAIAEETGNYIDNDLHRTIPEPPEVRQGGWVILRDRPTNPVPAILPLILGDFLTNARASLDYLVYDLVRANEEDPGSHTSFPICETEGKWRDDIIERDKAARGPAPTLGISSNVLEIIHEEQPLRHGSDKARKTDPLMHLLLMSNKDKHRRLHVGVLESGKVLDISIEPEGVLEILRFKPAAITGNRPMEGNREVARVQVRVLPGGDPDTEIYFRFNRASEVTFSLPGETRKATFWDLFGIINSIMRIGRRLEQHVEPPSTWFDDLFSGRVGGGHRDPSTAPTV